MVKLSIKIRPQRGYTYPNCIKQLETDSSTRLEDVLSGVKMDKKEIFLYSPTGIEMPLNSSLASHNLQDGDIIETCSSPVVSAVLSAVLADLDSIKALPEQGRTRETLPGLLDCADHVNIKDADWNPDRWTAPHLDRRMICLATMKKAIQRNDRFATKTVPPCHDLTSLYNFIQNNNIFSSAANGHSTGLECFKPSATNRNGCPTLCWELVQQKMNKFLSVEGNAGDLIEPFVKMECERHGHVNTPMRSNPNRSLHPISRPHRNLFLHTNGSRNSIPKCQECSNLDADSVCLVTTCPFYSKPTCTRCFHNNHPALSSRNHERTSLTDPAARTVLKKINESYCPEFASGPFAILCALLQAQMNRQYFLNESDLKAKAQLHCRSNLYDAQGYARSAFACIDTLTRKNLVRKELIHGSEDGKYSLMPEGEDLAKYCLAFSSAMDQVLNPACCRPPGMDRVSSSSSIADILWDRREDRTFAARFQSRCLECSIQSEERELPAGDYLFRLNQYILPLVVERKTWSDFADSVQGRGKERLRLECLRLDSTIGSQTSTCSCQLCRMKRTKVGRILFIIEGGRCTNPETQTNPCSCVYCKELRDRHGLSHEELEKYIYRLQVEHQCLVHFTRDYNDTIMSLVLMAQILPTISHDQYLTYDQFCSNAQSRQAGILVPAKRGEIVDVADDEIVKTLTRKSGEGSVIEYFQHKIHGLELVNLTDSQNAGVVATKTSQRKRKMEQDVIEILEDSWRNTEHDVVEILDDSFVQSPPKAKKARFDDRPVNLKTVVSETGEVGSTVTLLIVSGLYEYLSEFDHDVDKIWQSMYKSRTQNQNSIEFTMVAMAKLNQIQACHENIPLVRRRSILEWILYVQLRFPAIIHVIRKLSCRDRLVNLWDGSKKLAPIAPATKSSELQCAICRETLKGPNDAEFLPCTHSFHEACIQTWWAKCVSVKRCPVCKVDVRSETVENNYLLPPRPSAVQQTRTTPAIQNNLRAAAPAFQGAAAPAFQETARAATSDAAAMAREARLRYFSHSNHTAAVLSWTCKRCTYENLAENAYCAMCESSKIEDAPKTKTGSLTSPADPWLVASQIPTLFSTHENTLSFASPAESFGASLQSSNILSPAFVSSTTMDSKNKTCGACKGFGHNRSNYTAESCPCYFNETELEYRKKKKEKIQQLKDEKVRQLHEEKSMSDQRSTTAQQILSLAADLQKTEEKQKKASEAAQKKLQREVEKLSKKMEK